MQTNYREMDARSIIVLAVALLNALLAASIAMLISVIAFGIAGTEWPDVFASAMPIVGITFAGTFLGSAIGNAINAKKIEKAVGPLTLGQVPSQLPRLGTADGDGR